jgi:hypothetical protein
MSLEQDTMTSTDTPFRIITCRDNHDLLLQEQKRIGAEWPEFMLHDPVALKLSLCYEKLPDFQFILVDSSSNETVAIANSIPLLWEKRPNNLPQEGWDWALTKGIEDVNAGRKPNYLCALQIVVFGGNRGKGISTQAVQTMREIAKMHGLQSLIAPVRPNRKSEHPHVSIDEYVCWKDKDGLPDDPWLRVHARLGAKIIKPCHRAMRITGTVSEWEAWTKMSFPKTGDYEVPGALVPVQIDVQNDRGLYVEPNVWMIHT